MSLMDSNKQVDIAKVRQYLQGNADRNSLTAKDQKVLERWEFMHKQYRMLGIKSQVIKAALNEFDIKITTAYNDMRMMELVYGEMSPVEKNFERAWLADDIRKMMAEAREMKDIRGYASLVRELKEILRLDQNDLNLPDYSKILPPAIYIGNFQELLTNPLSEQGRKELEQLSKIKKPIKIQPDDEATEIE